MEATTIETAQASKAPVPEKQNSEKVYAIEPTAKPTALVVHCGDPRFQGPISRFLEESLGLKDGDYVPLVVGGGVASLTVGDMLPKEAKYLREAVGFYLGHFNEISRVILVNHEDCGKYKALAKTMPLFLQWAAGKMSERQKADLVKVAVALATQHRVTIETYFAAFTDETRTNVRFEKQ